MRIKKYKPLHWLYNILHYRRLKHNRDAYKRYGVHKPIFATISSKDFPDKKSRAWLDVGDSISLAETKENFTGFSSDLQSKIKSWSGQGYMILENFFDTDTIDQVNDEINRLTRNGKLKPDASNKLMFANRKSEIIRNVAGNKSLTTILQFILDKEVVPFQTINFIRGSGQRAHSDSIHMTTHPLGYLIAVWIALEDVTADSGPLFYYPGSHKLPYLLNSDFNEGETGLTLGNREYGDYEDVVEELIFKKEFKKEVFLAKKGDLLIWHANLVHGGMPVSNPASTRKSMVIHYYAKDVIKYHEITERPSLI